MNPHPQPYISLPNTQSYTPYNHFHEPIRNTQQFQCMEQMNSQHENRLFISKFNTKLRAYNHEYSSQQSGKICRNCDGRINMYRNTSRSHFRNNVYENTNKLQPNESFICAGCCNHLPTEIPNKYASNSRNISLCITDSISISPILYKQPIKQSQQYHEQQQSNVFSSCLMHEHCTFDAQQPTYQYDEYEEQTIIEHDDEQNAVFYIMPDINASYKQQNNEEKQQCYSQFQQFIEQRYEDDEQWQENNKLNQAFIENTICNEDTNTKHDNFKQNNNIIEESVEYKNNSTNLSQEILQLLNSTNNSFISSEFEQANTTNAQICSCDDHLCFVNNYIRSNSARYSHYKHINESSEEQQMQWIENQVSKLRIHDYNTQYRHKQNHIARLPLDDLDEEQQQQDLDVFSKYTGPETKVKKNRVEEQNDGQAKQKIVYFSSQSELGDDQHELYRILSHIKNVIKQDKSDNQEENGKIKHYSNKISDEKRGQYEKWINILQR